MSSESARIWYFYIDDMIHFSRKVIRYTQDCDQQGFIQNEIIYDATLRNLELIGEAANNIPLKIQENNSEIPWRQIIATRNRIIHGYLGIDENIIWSIITEEIPDLLGKLDRLKSKIS